MRVPSVRLSVKGRIAATTVALLSVSLGGLSAFVVSSTTDAAARSAEQLTEETAINAATRMQGELQRALGTARDLQSTLTGLQATGGTRPQADRVQRELLEQNEDYLGVWSGWERDAYDPDAAHVGEALPSGSGRFASYWYRDGGTVARDVLVDFEEEDYYAQPMTTGAEKVVDPYHFDLAGQSVLMTSVAVPLLRGGEPVGVAGVDIALSDLQERVEAIRVYGEGSATLVSTSGVVVAAPDAATVGKPAGDDIAALVEDAAAGTVNRTAGDVLRVATPLALGTQDTWTLVVDVPTSAVLAEANRLRNTIVVVALVSLAVAAGLAFLAARRLMRPVDALRERLVEISEGDGDLTQRVDDRSEDEIGALGAAFNRFVEKVAGTVREVVRTSTELATSAASLKETSLCLTDSTSATSSGTAELAAASKQIEGSVQTVATATEQMGATAQEIAASAASASRTAAVSVAAAADAASTLDSLGTSSAQIGEVVRVITGIAEQTNLLALNATIEAARAGEAGKGFAVVAGEVKELAQETARATDDIIARVENLQADAVRASEALARIASSIGDVDASQTSIATAVEEQAATVQSMAQTITQAADGTTQITSGIDEVDRLAVQTSEAADQTGRAADDLDRIAAQLTTLVGDFRC